MPSMNLFNDICTPPFISSIIIKSVNSGHDASKMRGLCNLPFSSSIKLRVLLFILQVITLSDFLLRFTTSPSKLTWYSPSFVEEKNGSNPVR